jgi:hypothetical protein
LALAVGLNGAPTLAQATLDDTPIAEITVEETAVAWQPLGEHAGLVLLVTFPDGTQHQQAFAPGTAPTFPATNADGEPYPDGTYSYVLQTMAADRDGGTAPALERAQSGQFTIEEGVFVSDGDPDAYVAGPMAPEDYVIYDDLIVDGSECVGFDCVDGESFGFDTIKLKENNLRIKFEDTSTAANFPTNDWQITINDSANGGGSYFAVDDVSGGRTPFKVEAGAPTDALYVDDYGRVGFGTDTPYVELHIQDGDTPTVRLDQDGTSGWAPQSWDMAGNETNLFVRDVTNGSTLPFRIQPGAPTNALAIRSDGSVGMGTWGPSANLHIIGESNPQIRIAETGGGEFKLVASTHVKLGSTTDNDVKFQRDNNTLLTLASGNQVGIGTDTPGFKLEVDGSAGKPGGGTWSNSSDARLKKDVAAIDGREALDLFAQLQGVTFQWINPEQHSAGTHAGLLAQDLEKVFPTWVDVCAVQGSDADLIPEGEKAKAIHFPHDFNAYTIEAIKALDAENQALTTRMKEQEAEIADLQARLAELEGLVAAMQQAQSASD